MKRAILYSLIVLVFCNVISAHEHYERDVSWIHGDSPTEYSLSEPQTTSYPVYFSVPLGEDIFFNQWTAEQNLGGDVGGGGVGVIPDLGDNVPDLNRVGRYGKTNGANYRAV